MKKDVFTNISHYIKLLYEYCKEAGVWLEIVEIAPTVVRKQASEEEYELEQNVWEKAETFEIMESLREDSIYYKGKPITKEEIMDFIIDWGLENLKKANILNCRFFVF